MVTKLEINIRSLLRNCEELSKDENSFWRLKKYIKSLETMIDEFKESNENYNQNTVSDYYSRLKELKTVINYQEPTPQLGLKPKLNLNTKLNNGGDMILNEIKQIQKSKNLSDMRKDLIGDDDGVRKRVNLQNENMDQAMKYYSNIQEKITEDMLTMTRNLKEQTRTANEIIKKDTEIVSKSAQLSDNNISSLTKETETLQDHTRKACKCWMWIMIGLVMMIFIFMVLFMKVMKKKTY